MKFTNIKSFHKNKNEIHKNRTLGKKPGQTPDSVKKYNQLYFCFYIDHDKNIYSIFFSNFLAKN